MNEDPRPLPPPPDALVFSGGGPDGIAFIGCIKWLEETYRTSETVKTIVGSSAGAIVGLLLALGLTSSEMELFVQSRYDQGNFRDLDVEGLVDFVERMGIDDGSGILSALREMVMTKVRPTQRSSDEDVTFVELTKVTGKSLVVCVTNLEDSKGELMSVDATPDMGVLLAVRMSFGVPLVFTPVRWEGKTYVDGCMFEFCPTAYLFGPQATSILTFRINYLTSSSLPGMKKNDMELPEYLSMLVRATMTRSTPIPTLRTLGHSWTPIVSKIVDVETLMMTDDPPCRFDLASLSLAMDRDGIRRYIKHGYEACRGCLDPPPRHADVF